MNSAVVDFSGEEGGAARLPTKLAISLVLHILQQMRVQT